jgi:hypothetical protein
MVPEPALPQYRNRHCSGATGTYGSSDTAATAPSASASVPVSVPLYRSRAEVRGAACDYGRQQRGMGMTQTLTRQAETR